MKRPHLLWVEAPPATFAPLFEAAAAAGLRFGWLEMAGETGPLPPSLEAAAALGALRAVTVTAERSVTVKPRRGPARLDDLLREHFLGCAAVLVSGDVPGGDAPQRLEALEGGGWSVGAPGETRELATDALLAHLRQPARGRS